MARPQLGTANPSINPSAPSAIAKSPKSSSKKATLIAAFARPKNSMLAVNRPALKAVLCDMTANAATSPSPLLPPAMTVRSS